MKLSEFKLTKEVIEKAGKCTSAEEVEKLAREYDVELTAEEVADILKYNSPKELNDEQLDQVAGGGDDWGDAKAKNLPRDHGRHIGHGESVNHIGKKVYCVDDENTDQFCWGILERAYETHDIIWMTKKVYNIRILGWNHDTDTLPEFGFISKPKHVPVGDVLEMINSSRCTLFLYNK